MSSLNSGAVKIPKNNQEYFGDADVTIEFSNSTSLQTHVSPAQNVNGVIVYSASILTDNAGRSSILLNTSAPTNTKDGAALAYALGHASGTYVSDVNVSFPLFVPPSYGLYSLADSSNIARSVVFKVL